MFKGWLIHHLCLDFKMFYFWGFKKCNRILVRDIIFKLVKAVGERSLWSLDFTLGPNHCSSLAHLDSKFVFFFLYISVPLICVLHYRQLTKTCLLSVSLQLQQPTLILQTVQNQNMKHIDLTLTTRLFIIQKLLLNLYKCEFLHSINTYMYSYIHVGL